jgi:hypothetical protein
MNSVLIHNNIGFTDKIGTLKKSGLHLFAYAFILKYNF